jgi:hypothetical protein
MIPSRHELLSEAVDLINRAGTGLLTTYDSDGRERLWIGTPVSTHDGQSLVSFLIPDHGICSRIGAWPLLQWRFHDEGSESHLVIEGRAALVAGPTWRRLHPGHLPANSARPFTAVVTTVESVQHIFPGERISCRVVLPATPVAMKEPAGVGNMNSRTQLTLAF